MITIKISDQVFSPNFCKCAQAHATLDYDDTVQIKKIIALAWVWCVHDKFKTCQLNLFIVADPWLKFLPVESV